MNRAAMVLASGRPPARASALNASAVGRVLLGIRPEHMHRQREGAHQPGFEPLTFDVLILPGETITYEGYLQPLP